MSDPCLTEGISPITVPELSATVGGAPATHSISATTSCGPATFTLSPEGNGLSITLTAAGSWEIKLEPMDNNLAGSYTVVLQTTLDNYQSVSVPDSSFQIVVIANTPPTFTTALED